MKWIRLLNAYRTHLVIIHVLFCIKKKRKAMTLSPMNDWMIKYFIFIKIKIRTRFVLEMPKYYYFLFLKSHWMPSMIDDGMNKWMMKKKRKISLKKEREILSTRSSSLVTNFFMVIDLFIRLNKWTDNIDDVNDNDDDMIADMCVCVCVWVQLKWMNEWINLSMSTISLSLLVSYLVLLKYSPISLKKLQISFFCFCWNLHDLRDSYGVTTKHYHQLVYEHKLDFVVVLVVK